MACRCKFGPINSLPGRYNAFHAALVLSISHETCECNTKEYNISRESNGYFTKHAILYTNVTKSISNHMTWVYMKWLICTTIDHNYSERDCVTFDCLYQWNCKIILWTARNNTITSYCALICLMCRLINTYDSLLETCFATGLIRLW